MSTPSDPLTRSTTATDPDMGRMILVMMIVFVVGLVVIGVIYLTGTPITNLDGEGKAEQDAAAVTPTTQTDPTDTQAPGEPYLAANGTSPLPKHGEGIAAPIAADRLITDEAYSALPPEPSTLPAPDGPVAWTEASDYLGQTITVKGTIVDTNNIGQICFLNYDPDWQDKFYIAIFKEAFELLPDPPEQHYLNRTLLVTGKVTLHKDRPQIEVRDVSQIEVVE